jgi:hypothetical protein
MNFPMFLESAISQVSYRLAKGRTSLSVLARFDRWSSMSAGLSLTRDHFIPTSRTVSAELGTDI